VYSTCLYAQYVTLQNIETSKGLRLLSAKPFAMKILKHQDDIVKNYLLKLTVKIFKEQNWPFKLPGWNRNRQAGLHFFGRHEGTKSVPS
jgi:hypothetical protein